MGSSRSLRRPPPTRTPKRKFVIYSEGKNTEPDYFEAVRRTFVGAIVDVEIVEAAGVPMTIAEAARDRAAAMRRGRARRSSFEQDDQVWAVFDRDEHPRVGEAQALCRAAQVGIAFSDPCFELWLLLHNGDFDRPDNRHQVQKALANVCKDYDPDRRKTADFAAMMHAVRAAEDRAERQIARRREEGDPPRRPFTTVFELTRAMRTAHDAHTGKGAD